MWCYRWLFRRRSLATPGRCLVPAAAGPAAGAERTGARSLRQFRITANEDLRNPIGMREAAGRKGLKFPVHVIIHATDGWFGVIQQEVCRSAIAVVRKTNAACVGDDHS